MTLGGREEITPKKWEFLSWDNSFISFLRYIGPKPNSADTLDKIVPESGYVPDNIRWASKKTQAKNRDTTVFITARGKLYQLQTGQFGHIKTFPHYIPDAKEGGRTGHPF